MDINLIREERIFSYHEKDALFITFWEVCWIVTRMGVKRVYCGFKGRGKVSRKVGC